MIYLSSDLHLFHNREFIYKPRGFESIEDMNSTLFQNFWKVVEPEDDLYLLGDLLLGGNESFEKGLALISHFPGQIHIVRGNHDTNKRWDEYAKLFNVVEVKNSIYLKYNNYHFYLSHFPSLTSNYDDDKPLKQKLINLCGHIHTKDPFADFDKGILYHCEVDAHNCYPINIDTILKEIRVKINEERS